MAYSTEFSSTHTKCHIGFSQGPEPKSSYTLVLQNSIKTEFYIKRRLQSPEAFCSNPSSNPNPILDARGLFSLLMIEVQTLHLKNKSNTTKNNQTKNYNQNICFRTYFNVITHQTGS